MTLAPMTLSKTLTLALVLSLALSAPAGAITIDFLPVGNLGNSSESSGFLPGPDVGAVDYDYSIGETEVTVAQYTEFLNAKAGDADPKGLYNASMAISKADAVYTALDPSKPINYVSWGDAARFANWVNNGGGAGDMETGTYALGGVTDSASLFLVTRGAGTVFLPSEDEWHKAAYHKNDGDTGNYWEYGTSSDAIPTGESPAGGSNSVNYASAVGALTDVGSYTTAVSPYGAFDMSGNVEEWTDTIIFLSPTSKFSIHAGGAWNDSSFGISAQSGRTGVTDRTSEIFDRGIRLATTASGGSEVIPEPSTFGLATFAMMALGFFGWRRRRRRR
jgi:sulfatase modifying factor 1